MANRTPRRDPHVTYSDVNIGFRDPVGEHATDGRNRDAEQREHLLDWVTVQLRVEARRGGTPTTVYLMHDRNHRLLYVGITNHQTRRVTAHANTQPWFPDCTYILTEQWNNRTIATRREAYLIWCLGPAYNKAKPNIKLHPADIVGGKILDLLAHRIPIPFPLEDAPPSGMGSPAYRYQASEDTAGDWCETPEVYSTPDVVRALYWS